MKSPADIKTAEVHPFEFEGRTDLTDIAIPDCVKEISVGAFMGCTSLRSVKMASGVTTIGDSAFTSCTALESVVIPEGVTSIGECAFSQCVSLKSIALPESLVTVGSDAFDGCPCQKEADTMFKDIKKRRKELEKKRKEEEERRKAEEARIAAEEEARRIAEEKRKAKEEADRKKAEEKRKAEEEAKRIAEEKRKAKEEADRKKAEEEKAAQEKAKKKQKKEQKAQAAKPAKTAEPAKAKTEKQPSTQDDGLPYVDLGLSVKWAKCNLGASSIGDKGDTYAWGEIKAKSEYDWSNYKFGKEPPFSKYQPKEKILVKKHLFRADEYKTIGDGKTVLELCDDVAHAKMGGKWRMPTIEEFRELCDKCTWTRQIIDGEEGYMVKSKKKGFTDKWIFFPSSSYNDLSEADSWFDDDLFIIWTSSLDVDDCKTAWGVNIHNRGRTVVRETGTSVRMNAWYIRPVLK